jgi:hypothetical protein
LLIESPDGFLGNGPLGVIDEGEAARPAGFPVHRKDDLGWCADAGQMLPEICLVCGVRQIPDKQTD